jgi:hypothetical protein
VGAGSKWSKGKGEGPLEKMLKIELAISVEVILIFFII